MNAESTVISSLLGRWVELPKGWTSSNEFPSVIGCFQGPLAGPIVTIVADKLSAIYTVEVYVGKESVLVQTRLNYSDGWLLLTIQSIDDWDEEFREEYWRRR